MNPGGASAWVIPPTGAIAKVEKHVYFESPLDVNFYGSLKLAIAGKPWLPGSQSGYPEIANFIF